MTERHTNPSAARRAIVPIDMTVTLWRMLIGVGLAILGVLVGLLMG